MDFEVLKRSFYALLFVHFIGIKGAQEVPFELNDEILNGVEERFSALLSDELREKLLKHNSTGLDVANLEQKGFSESERKEIEEALIKSFQPFFTEFAKEVVKSALPPNATEEKTEKDEVDRNKAGNQKNQTGENKKTSEQKKDDKKEEIKQSEKESTTNGKNEDAAKSNLKVEDAVDKKNGDKMKQKEEL